jgi:hypothetical protein
VATFVAGFPSGTEKIGIGILEKRGIVDVKPESWYPLQPFLDAMKDISDKLGAHILTRVGEQIATHAKLPPGLDSLEECLAKMDDAFHMNHRGGDIGHYRYAEGEHMPGLKRAVMVCENPYPCSFDQGLFEGFAKRLLPGTAAGVVVRHDEAQPCRKHGADSCTFLISWG